ncbi:MAG: diphthine--ammonia ligase [Deltaproteobacteria bacterium]
MREKIILSWSGGKDSTLALYELMKGDYDIKLLTTITDEYGRISMHGVREALLEQQARALGCPLEKVYITPRSSNAEYETKMTEVMERYKRLGVNRVAFGDLFLEDIRKYRENNLARLGMQTVFPLWGRDTRELAGIFIGLGFKSIITCVDTDILDGDFAGRLFDEELLSDLPDYIDPCGEKGEFHSFVFDGPVFSKAIAFSTGKKVLRDNRFCFCDLVPDR